MFAYKLHQVLFIFIVNGCYGQRRIKDGEPVQAPKRYMVYLLKAPVSPLNYDGWLCGGALVSAEYIVTSAACVTDVIHLYAIAGYNKYVRDTDINSDRCTKTIKKKVVLICTPQAYELKYEEVEKWSFIDIAVVKVESPYNFNDRSFELHCSYPPQSIPINYETKYQEPKVDAIVFGWGHKREWREVNDPTDLNEPVLMYAPTLIQEKEDCKREYAVYNGMDQIIDKYMICTSKKGNINDAGLTIVQAEPTAEGCNTKLRKLRGMESVVCENDNNPGQEIVLIETRKDNKLMNHTIDSLNKTDTNNLTQFANVDPKLSQNVDKQNERNIDQKLSYLNNDVYRNILDTNSTHNNRRYLNSEGLRTRRHGICQNDHGGPLVTWVGSHEVLIGVASVFKITEDRECIGPYLFTSTQCNGAFLDCILKSDDSKTNYDRRAICDRELGFKLVETHISWVNHPDGPAMNEQYLADSNGTFHAKIDLKIEKQQPEDLHAITNITSLFHNFTSTNQVLNKTNPFNNGMPTKTSTDKNLTDTTPTNLTNAALKKDNSSLLTNSSLTLPTNVTSINILNALSTELNKTLSGLELTIASSVDINNSNVTSKNLTSLTPSNANSIADSLQNVNSSKSFNLSNLTLTNARNKSEQESATILTSAVRVDLTNITNSISTPRTVAS